MKISSPVDVASGGVFVAIGIVGLWMASDLRFGTGTRMGPGYLPFMLCWLLVGLGLVIALRGIVIVGQNFESWNLRPLCVVLLSIACFAWSIQRLGILVAVALTVGVAAGASPGARKGEVALLAAGLALFCAALFVILLGLPIPLWPALPRF